MNKYTVKLTGFLFVNKCLLSTHVYCTFTGAGLSEETTKEHKVTQFGFYCLVI